MKLTIGLIILICTGCVSVTKNLELSSPGKPHAEVIMYRPWAFSAGANSMFVGINDKYFGSLGNNQYMSLKIDAGIYDFQVTAQASSSFSLRVDLRPDEKVCLKSNINPAAAGVMLVPFVANMIAWFQLTEVQCPDADFFSDFTKTTKS